MPATSVCSRIATDDQDPARLRVRVAHARAKLVAAAVGRVADENSGDGLPASAWSRSACKATLASRCASSS